MHRFLFLLLLLCIPRPASAQQRQPLASADLTAAEIFRQDAPTAMVLVLVRDHDVHLQTFGETAPGSGVAPGPNSLMRLCSLTKIFATDLLTKLLTDKTLRLDDSLQMFAPSGALIPVATIHGPAARAITLGDLATHTAGLPRELGPAPQGTQHFTFPNHAQRWAWLPRQKLRAAPGTVALYSNVGFDLLGDALASAAHKPYAQLLAERTTGPLAMRDTTFTPTSDQCSRLLLAIREKRDGCTDTEASAGSAGLYSTPNDMVRWLQYLLGVSELKQNPAAQAEYVRPVDLLNVKGLDHAGEPAGIGLGWMLLGEAGTPGQIVEKTGGGGGFTTYIALNPTQHTGVFVAMTEGGGDWRLNPFLATNNLLLGLSGLPQTPLELRPPRPTPHPGHTIRRKRARRVS